MDKEAQPGRNPLYCKNDKKISMDNTPQPIMFLRKKLKACQHKKKIRLSLIHDIEQILVGFRKIGNVTKVREYTAILSLERNLLNGENKRILDLNKQIKQFKKL